MPVGRTSKLIAIVDDDEGMEDSLRDQMEAAGLVAGGFGSAGSTRFRHSSSVRGRTGPLKLGTAEAVVLTAKRQRPPPVGIYRASEFNRLGARV
jgi:hypothetical protein